MRGLRRPSQDATPTPTPTPTATADPGRPQATQRRQPCAASRRETSAPPRPREALKLASTTPGRQAAPLKIDLCLSSELDTELVLPDHGVTLLRPSWTHASPA